MRKTPQQFRREGVIGLFDKTLGKTKTSLVPLSISASESLRDDFTTTDFSFEESGDTSGVVSISDSKGKGFIDGLFAGLHRYYIEKYPSIEKIRLVDIMVNPIMKVRTKLGSDAKASIVFRVEVDGHGISEFQHKSRSVIYSGFSAALSAFQFYINCERSFYKIKFACDDAAQRNRGDIMQSCMTDLSKLTEMNTYAKR